VVVTVPTLAVAETPVGNTLASPCTATLPTAVLAETPDTSTRADADTVTEPTSPDADTPVRIAAAGATTEPTLPVADTPKTLTTMSFAFPAAENGAAEKGLKPNIAPLLYWVRLGKDTAF
jgi:hypothetical protein